MKVPDYLVERREHTEARLTSLGTSLERVGAGEIAANCACVYVTGSGGRGEMAGRSDLDVFILRDDKNASTRLTNLDEIRLKARLIEVSRSEGFDDFSGDGEFVRGYDVHEDIIGKLGGREDDYANVFTARLLLLLESRPLLGKDMYDRALDEVIATYWRDYPKNSKNFLPVFLMNDILRFWKTLCLNYEERTGEAKTGKRRLLNYKLKHSRLLTCYSAILYLLVTLDHEKGTISPEVAKQMISESPTRRLEVVATLRPDAAEKVQALLGNYVRFLQTCDANKSELEDKFSTPDFKRERFAEARKFGDDVFTLLHLVGEKSPLLRYLVV